MDDPRLTSAATESEQRYRWLREYVADYHYCVRVENGEILHKLHGSGCEVTTGFRPEEYSADSKLWIKMVVEEDRPVVEGQIASVLAGGHPPPIEFRIQRKDGQLRWLNKTVVPYYNEDGRLIAYDALLSDITQRKQAEILLRESEKRFRLLFEDDLTGDYLADPDGTIVLCNQAFVDIFGFSSREEAVGSNLANLYLAPLSWSSFVELLCENQVLERHERAGRHSDGTVRHVIETVIGTFDAEGKLLRIKGYVFDDTDAKMATARLKRQNEELEKAVDDRTRVLHEKQEHLQAIWDSAFDAIITIDRSGLILTANLAAEQMFGYTAGELLGKNVSLLMPQPYRSEHDGYISRYHESGQKRILDNPRELIAVRRDGSIFPIDLSVTQIDNSGCFTGVIRDISERKRMQRHLLEVASEEQRRIGRELHDGTGQELTGLTLSTSALLEMLDAASTPVLENRPVRQFDESAFGRIRDTIFKINQRLIDANRNVHELCHGIMPVQIDVGSLQSSLEELVASIDMPPAIRCRFVCPHSVVVADNSTATHLYRIAQEAVNNALRHSQASEIVVSLQQNGKEIVLEVIDNGIGIDEKYRRIAEAKKDHGMGMRTMQYRAGIIGGSLQIERRNEGGTSVKCIAIQLEESEPT
ncbi:MAG: PAS domain S-box protein [Pirellulaceae bacterium]|nr:PAS domain S-box protein [Pirellulaceae bacterium]